MARTHTICMSHEQLRVIAHALRHADMRLFTPNPANEADADASQIETLAFMAIDTLADFNEEVVQGWAV